MRAFFQRSQILSSMRAVSIWAKLTIADHLIATSISLTLF